MSETVIELEHVSFKYKGSEEGLLNDTSLTVTKGETLLLTGASGSGKTTILRLINGLIPHYYQGDVEGKVTVAGKVIADTELYELAGIVGTVFQNPRSQFFSIDTDGEIVFGPENIGLDPKEIQKRKEDVVEEMHIGKLLGRSLFELSGGEKQSIACASVSALLPEIILLDEPSSNLDQSVIKKLAGQIRMWKDEGKTIVISEHRLWYLKNLVDRVIYMDHGNIAHEWNGKEFASFGKEKIKELKLRPLEVADILSPACSGDCDCEGNCKIDLTVPDPAGGITLKNFYFSYHRNPYLFWKKSFDENDKNLSLCIPRLVLPKGAVIGVVGKNGTGKSTFLKCLCGLEKDCKGIIECDYAEYRGRKRLGFCYMVMQDVNHQLFTDSVESEVLLSMKEEDKERCDKILDSLGILEFKDKHPMALSGGQKQRVAIASAMAADAKLMLFDEPTSGLDYSHMEKVGELLKELASTGDTVLVATHDPELIELCCDYVLCIENGKLGYMKKVQQ
ncbi:MAG: ABC transporter ATP-binding protein [Ruminococcaceae bacterium]|nr:ABC transporter ATP-binding protein [Oscillospiraceae bacterium]